MSSKDANRMDRFTQFAMVASDEAIADAGLDEAGIDPYRIGVMVSSAAGGFKTFEKNHMAMIQKGPTKGSPFTVPMLIVDMASGRVSMKHGYKGVNKAVVSACATGSHSIGDAFRTIQYGDADVMVAGGCEATITTLGIGAFTAARTLSKRMMSRKKLQDLMTKIEMDLLWVKEPGFLFLKNMNSLKNAVLTFMQKLLVMANLLMLMIWLLLILREMVLLSQWN